MEFSDVKGFVIALVIVAPRLYASLSIAAFLGRRMMTGLLVRNGVILTFALFIVPTVHGEIKNITMDWLTLITIIGKEFIIGFLIGYTLNIPFWLGECIGAFIDNQRGATIASSMNFLADSFASPLSGLFSQGIMTLFFSSGAFLLFLKGLFISYVSWPVTSFVPTFETEAMMQFLIAQFSSIVYWTVVLGAPVAVAMFLAEFGFAMVGRFSPSLNVFFIAMPIKSAVSMFMFVLYTGTVIRYFSGEFSGLDELVNVVFGLIDGK